MTITQWQIDKHVIHSEIQQNHSNTLVHYLLKGTFRGKVSRSEGHKRKVIETCPAQRSQKKVDKRIIFLPVRALFHPTSYEHGSISFFTHCLFLSGIFSIRVSGLEGFHLSLCVCAATYHRRSILWNNVIG